MKYEKKTIAIICAAVCALTPFTFAACGSNNGSGDDKGQTVKGEQVTELQWKEAIDNSKLAENYTMIYEKTETSHEETFYSNGAFYVDLINKIGHCYIDKYPMMAPDGFGIIYGAADIYCIIDANIAYRVTVRKDGSIDVECESELYDATPREIIEAALYSTIYHYGNPLGTFMVYATNDLGEERKINYDQAYSKFAFDEKKLYYAYETKAFDINYGYFVTIANEHVQSIQTTETRSGIVKYKYTYAYGATKIVVPPNVRQAIDNYVAE